MSDPELQHLLARSRSELTFKEAVQSFLAGADPELIKVPLGAPRIKILRVLKKLLSEYQDEPITDVTITGRSSCSAFEGHLTFGPDSKEIQFSWDCHWKAAQEGLMTYYGQPDQASAAATFGYQCFRDFTEMK